MEIILGILIIVRLVAVVWLFSETNKWRTHYIESERALEEARASKKLAPAKTQVPSPAAVEQREGPTKKELDEARDEIKDLKKSLYDIKSENKTLRQDIEQAKEARPVADSDALFALRQELGQAKAELAEWKERASSKPRTRVESTPEPTRAPEPVRKEVEKAGPAPTASAEEIRKLEEGHQAELRALRDEMRALEAELTDRLKKTSRNVNKQRQRADNNDRAYKITQRQLDAAQERIDYLEGQLKKSTFIAQSSAGAAAEATEPLPAAVTEKTGDEAKVEAAPADQAGQDGGREDATSAGAPEPETIKEGGEAAPEGTAKDVADTIAAHVPQPESEADQELPPAVTEKTGEEAQVEAAPSAQADDDASAAAPVPETIKEGDEAAPQGTSEEVAEAAADAPVADNDEPQSQNETSEGLPPAVTEKTGDASKVEAAPADQADAGADAPEPETIKEGSETAPEGTAEQIAETNASGEAPVSDGEEDEGSASIDDAWADIDVDEKS